MDVAAFTLVWIGLALYALLAGADFGVGLWVLVASLAKREEEIRKAAFGYFGPVWEVNGLWLVFFIVGLMAAFPKALALLSRALIALVLFALVMFVVRSCAYALLHHGPERYHGVAQWTFGISSVLAAMGLGYAAVAPSSGFIRGDTLEPGFYISTLSLSALPLTLTGSAHLAATVIAAYAHARERGEVATEWLRRAGLVAGAAMLPLTVIFTIALVAEVDYIGDQLSSLRVLPMVAGGVAVLLGMVSLLRRRYASAALLVFGGYFAALMGGAFVQYPYMVYPELTIAEGAAPSESLLFYLVITALGGPLLIAAMLALYNTALGPERAQSAGPL